MFLLDEYLAASSALLSGFMPSTPVAKIVGYSCYEAQNIYKILSA
jgi:hypothetical protein